MNTKVGSFYRYNHFTDTAFGKCKYYSLFLTSIKMWSPGPQSNSWLHVLVTCVWWATVLVGSQKTWKFLWAYGVCRVGTWGTLVLSRVTALTPLFFWVIDVCKSGSFKLQTCHSAVKTSEFASLVAQVQGQAAFKQCELQRYLQIMHTLFFPREKRSPPFWTIRKQRLGAPKPLHT